MRIGREKCPRRVGSDDLESEVMISSPSPQFVRRAWKIKGIRAHLRRVENYQGRGSSERAFLGLGTSSFSNKRSTTGSPK